MGGGWQRSFVDHPTVSHPRPLALGSQNPRKGGNDEGRGDRGPSGCLAALELHVSVSYQVRPRTRRGEADHCEGDIPIHRGEKYLIK